MEALPRWVARPALPSGRPRLRLVGAAWRGTRPAVQLESAAVTLTEHAGVRTQQRGLHGDDLSLVLSYGTRGHGAVVLTARDVARHTARLRHVIRRLEGLSGVGVVLDGRTVVTVMRPDREKRRRMLGKKASRRSRRSSRVGRA